jgi:hypothetical protein
MTFHEAAKLILQEYEFLHYDDITQIALERWYIETKWETPENTMNAHIWTLDKKNNKKNNFIRVWEWIYALRKKLDEDNLLTFLNCRLYWNNLWIITDKDEKILFDIFWEDIISNAKKPLWFLLTKLKETWKIDNFQSVWNDLIVKLIKKVNNLDEKIEILTQETLKLKELWEQVNKNSWIQEFSNFSKKLTWDFLNVFQEITKNTNALDWFWTEQLEWIEKTQKTLQEVISNNFWKNLLPLFDSINQITEAFSKTKLPKESLDELNKISSQINFLKNIFTNSDLLFDTIVKTNWFNNFINDWNFIFSPPPFNVNNDEKISIKGKLKIKKENYTDEKFTHNFLWLSQEWDFKIIRWYANIKELAKISSPIYFKDWWSQRGENKERCLKINSYIDTSPKRFIPEVVLWISLFDNNAISIKKSNNNELFEININFDKLEKWQISRIDGNHRLYYAEKLKNDFTIPFCFVIFDQRWETSDIQTIHKNQEANIFYLLNGKNEPVTSEEALQVLLNMPDEEAESLYQNDSTLWFTRLCKEKYNKYLSACKEDTNRNFWDKVYTKFQLLIKYIEKLWIENSKVDKLLDKIFSSINHLDDKYNKIISRNDFLYLVLNVVLDNQEKSSPQLNRLLMDFFDWILKEWLENISSSEKPILWELKKKDIPNPI